MTWIKDAGTCKNGPCPALHRDDETGRVRPQGTRVEPHIEVPCFEGMLEYAKEEWDDLVKQWLEQHPHLVQEHLERHPDQARQWLEQQPA